MFAHFGITPDHQVSGLLLVALVLRAFSSGCTALTGVEAVSNGVPNFKPPKSSNAADTLAIMGVLTVTMFAGITALAMAAHVHVVDNTACLADAPAGYERHTVIAQLAGAVFGHHSPFFFAVQGFTAVLVLAANTAFNGFPILAPSWAATATCRDSSTDAGTGWCSPTGCLFSPHLRGCSSTRSTRPPPA